MKIICIGRNYAEHIEELDGRRDIPSAPVFFCKPDTALLRNNDPFYVPAFSREVHYEPHLVVATGRETLVDRTRHAADPHDQLGFVFLVDRRFSPVSVRRGNRTLCRHVRSL